MSWLQYQMRKLLRPETIEIDSVQVFIGSVARTSYARSLYRGSHETEEREVIRRHLKPGDRVLEFGSGIGLVTVTCCKIAGSENVVTFEANPSMEPLLRRTFELNNVKPNLNMKMVGSHAGTAQFFASDRFVVSSSIHRGGNATAISVDQVSFHETVSDVRPTFIVMDIEGAETNLFDDQVDLSSVSKLCIEVHPQMAGDAKTSHMIESILAHGFCLQLSESKGDVLFFQRPALTAGRVADRAA